MKRRVWFWGCGVYFSNLIHQWCHLFDVNIQMDWFRLKTFSTFPNICLAGQSLDSTKQHMMTMSQLSPLMRTLWGWIPLRMWVWPCVPCATNWNPHFVYGRAWIFFNSLQERVGQPRSSRAPCFSGELSFRSANWRAFLRAKSLAAEIKQLCFVVMVHQILFKNSGSFPKTQHKEDKRKEKERTGEYIIRNGLHDSAHLVIKMNQPASIEQDMLIQTWVFQEIDKSNCCSSQQVSKV